MVTIFARAGIVTSATVTPDKLNYNSGETATVTVTGGQFGLHEWVAFYLASDPDSSFSYGGNWQYLNGTQTAPTSPPTYPVVLTFTVTNDPGTYNFRYFREAGVANRLAISQNLTVATGPSITTDASDYGPGENIVVTVNNGLSGTQEWAALYVASNPDSSLSYLSHWQYVGSASQTEGAAPTYPKELTFEAPFEAGDYNMRLFRENGPDHRLALSANFTITVSAFVPDRYASPTGTGDGLSSSTPYQITNFWSQVSGSVRSLGLLNGTYQGANSMIVPSVSGSSGDPITIKAINDGQVLIDGQFARIPCNISAKNYLVIEGINFKNCSTDQACVLINDGNNNIFRRCGAWDAYDDVHDTDTVVWAITGGSDNLLEDCFGFGIGRYILYTISSGSDTLNNICRRCWFRFDEYRSDWSHPRATVLPNYHGDESMLLENCIVEYRGSTQTTHWDGPFLCMEGTGYNTGSAMSGFIKIRGCFFFVGPNTQDYHSAAGFGLFLWAVSNHTDVSDLTIYIDPANYDYGTGLKTNANPNSPYDGQLTNIIDIGTTASSVHSGWSPTNVNHYSTTAACPDPYLYLTNRWIDGMETSTPLWPWPMQSRILAATALTSWPSGDVHADVEACLGTLP